MTIINDGCLKVSNSTVLKSFWDINLFCKKHLQIQRQKKINTTNLTKKYKTFVGYITEIIVK